jgi:hypothetical protein
MKHASLLNVKILRIGQLNKLLFVKINYNFSIYLKIMTELEQQVIRNMQNAKPKHISRTPFIIFMRITTFYTMALRLPIKF